MSFIIITTTILFIVLILWTWHNLGNSIEKNRKILYIIIGIVLIGILTEIIFQLSKASITYPNNQVMHAIQNMLVLLFTGLNGCIIMPYIAITLSKFKQNEIEKQTLQKRFLIIIIVVIVIIVLEKSYMVSTQEGILDILNELKRQS